MFNFIRSLLVASTLFSAGFLQAETLDLGVDSRSSIGLVIYNQDLALVNDTYSIRLPAGQNRLDFSAVSPWINFASAVLHPLPKTMSVVDQYFRGALTSEQLMVKSIGQVVSLVSVHPVSGEETQQRARILSVNGGLILEIDGHYETSLAGRRIVYDSLPEGVISPTLSIGVDSKVATESELVLSYLTRGLSWQADYVAQLNNSGDAIQLQAMASVSNHAGVDYENVQIDLVAGSVNQVRNNLNVQRERVAAAKMDSVSSIQPTSLADLYVYTLPRVFDLASDSTRQVKLFETREVPVEKLYLLAGQANVYYSPNVPEQKLKIDSYIEFSNDSDHQLGMPMPAGVVRVYAQKEAQLDRLHFIGEDRIGHISTGEKVRLKTGNAFDLRGVRKQLSFRRLPVEAPFRHHSEARVQVVLKNASEKPVTVQVWETYSGEWSLIEGPRPVESDAHSARWNVLVPAKAEAALELTVRVKR